MTAPDLDLYPDALRVARIGARACGYAIGVHGSESRDLDLIAVPWVEVVCTPHELAQRIADAVGGWLRTDDVVGPYPRGKPHGRLAFVILLPAKNAYIDLSVMP